MWTLYESEESDIAGDGSEAERADDICFWDKGKRMKRKGNA